MIIIYFYFFTTANHKAGPSEEEPLTDEQRHLASSTAIPSDDNRSSEDVRKAPNLYFDVEEAKEKKYSTYEELRKKHRERWNPPNVSSSSQTRMEQVGNVYSPYEMILMSALLHVQ